MTSSQRVTHGGRQPEPGAQTPSQPSGSPHTAPAQLGVHDSMQPEPAAQTAPHLSSLPQETPAHSGWQRALLSGAGDAVGSGEGGSEGSSDGSGTGGGGGGSGGSDGVTSGGGVTGGITGAGGIGPSRVAPMFACSDGRSHDIMQRPQLAPHMMIRTTAASAARMSAV